MASSCNEPPSLLVLPGTSMQSIAMQPGLAAHSFEEHCKLIKSNWWRRSGDLPAQRCHVGRQSYAGKCPIAQRLGLSRKLVEQSRP